MEYIALIHKNTDSLPTSEEWSRFFAIATKTGVFKGGSEIGNRHAIGEKEVSDTTLNVGGYMRFDSDDLNLLKDLLKKHPVIKHGGTIELCEMLKS
jgi:hypothetical protein